MKVSPNTCTQRYLNVVLKSIICLTVVLAAMNSEPQIAVCTTGCFLEYVSMIVLLTMCIMSVTDYLVVTPCIKLAFSYAVNITGFLSGFGVSWEIHSLTSP